MKNINLINIVSKATSLGLMVEAMCSPNDAEKTYLSIFSFDENREIDRAFCDTFSKDDSTGMIDLITHAIRGVYLYAQLQDIEDPLLRENIFDTYGDVIIPNCYHYLAIDEDGDVFAYCQEPTRARGSENLWVDCTGKSPALFMGTLEPGEISPEDCRKVYKIRQSKS